MKVQRIQLVVPNFQCYNMVEFEKVVNFCTKKMFLLISDSVHDKGLLLVWFWELRFRFGWHGKKTLCTALSYCKLPDNVQYIQYMYYTTRLSSGVQSPKITSLKEDITQLSKKMLLKYATNTPTKTYKTYLLIHTNKSMGLSTFFF